MEEHRLRMFENRVLRRIFGPKRDGETGEWRKLHNEELNDLYSSPNIVWVIKTRIMRWAGHVAPMEEGRGVHKVLVGKPEGKIPFGRPRCRGEDNVKMDLQEVGRGYGDLLCTFTACPLLPRLSSCFVQYCTIGFSHELQPNTIFVSCFYVLPED